MRSGGLTLIPLVLLAAGCAAQRPIAVRPAGSAPLALTGPVSQRVAYADAQLQLGNVALALEAYRRASREEPGSVGAWLGMAECYDRMERFDLSRRYFESALAVRPADPILLKRFAASRERAGDPVAASALRREALLRETAPASAALAVANAEPPQPANEPVQVEAATSVTVPLPVAEPPQMAEPPQAAERSAGPRLERLSLEEVALVTGPPVRWRDMADRAGDREDAPIRILNAARVQGLAARTRMQLRQLGWRGLSIGNAPVAQANTLILYPATRRGTAERLRRQFGAAMLRQAKGGELVMLLGRDLLRSRVTAAR